MFIIVDEYGKFLEYAAKNNSEESLYFIQELAEFINAPERKHCSINFTTSKFRSIWFRTLAQKKKMSGIK